MVGVDDTGVGLFLKEGITIPYRTWHSLVTSFRDSYYQGEDVLTCGDMCELGGRYKVFIALHWVNYRRNAHVP